MSYFDFVTYCNEDTIKNIVPKNRFSDRKLSIRTLKDVIIIPADSSFGEYQGEICDRNGKIINGVNSNVDYENLNNVDISQLIIDDTIEESCIYLGAIPNCWGHFITDGISKIYNLNELEYGEWGGKMCYSLLFVGAVRIK